MFKGHDPFVIKETGGSISDRGVPGFSYRAYEGTTLGDNILGTLRRVVSKHMTIVLAVLALAPLFFLFIR